MSPVIVLLLTLVYLGVVMFFRTWVHWRRTGSTGFRGLSGRPGSFEWWGGAAFILGIAFAVAAPLARLLSTDGVSALLVEGNVAAPLSVIGVVLYASGFVATYRSQTVMGSSWRIGVDESERTSLVTAGAFRFVRNPIFTSMLLAGAGLFLLLPTALSLAAFAALFIAVEIQVRAVEEPYLLRCHGEDYRRYARRAGRFVPGLGRLSARDEPL